MENTRSKIHIIANCASRKRIAPVIELNSILQTDIRQKALSWWVKINAHYENSSDSENLSQENSRRIKAGDLYIGSYWSVIRNLSDIARIFNFDTQLWIISAGYGLISSSDEIYSYSATFTPGDKNSVINGESDIAKPKETLSLWWETISNKLLPQNANPRKIKQLFQENSGDYFLILASADYLSAIENDLLEAINFLSSAENLVIITSKSFSNENLQKNIITADARLQCSGNCSVQEEKHLLPPGVRGTISAALAGKIIERAEVDGFNAQKLKHYIENRIKDSPALVNFNRGRLDDKEICRFIGEELEKLPSASWTSLLRKLRDSNLACEQKRFRELYRKTKRSAI